MSDCDLGLSCVSGACVPALPATDLEASVATPAAESGTAPAPATDSSTAADTSTPVIATDASTDADAGSLDAAEEEDTADF
jgi:hypothetical protein